MLDLTQERERAAILEWSEYEFGDSVIEDVDGWTFEDTSGAVEFTRIVYFSNEDSESPTLKGHFTVQFPAGSAEPSDVYAMVNGNMEGYSPNRRSTAAP